MQAKTAFLCIFAVIIAAGCTQQPPLNGQENTNLPINRNETSPDLNIPDNIPDNTAEQQIFAEARAENIALSLDDFNSEDFPVSQFEGQYTRDTTFTQQYTTFFKPVGYPVIPLDGNTFVLTQTLTIISSKTAHAEIEAIYKSGLSAEKEKHSLAILETEFAGDSSTLIKSTLGEYDLYKAFVAYGNTYSELSLLTSGMPSKDAKAKLLEYVETAMQRISSAANP